MKTKLLAMVMAGCSLTGCVENKVEKDDFKYTDEQFADIQMLRYRVPGFETLPLRQKLLIYNLAEASLQGRDILFDQNGRFNLRIRRILETVYTHYKGNKENADFKALATYLKRVWFSNGIYHHYGSEKFEPNFSSDFFLAELKKVPLEDLPLEKGQTVDDLCSEVFPIMFDASILPMRVNQKDGDDLVLTSGENYYGDGITQVEAEAFYAKMKDPNDPRPIMYGLNSRLVKENGKLVEKVWKVGGLYGSAIQKIVDYLLKAKEYADSEEQKNVIDKLVAYYETGDLRKFDEYCIAWVENTEDLVDFTNGFTESYGDPLGLKASWEGFVNFKDIEATKRAQTLSNNAQWFEDHSPVDKRFKKEETKGITAKVITAAILGGDLYPSTAIGINLPNSDWVRAEHGSKSVTISNLTSAYSKAAHGNGFNEEFVINDEVRALIDKYGDRCDDLHTDLHECLGHGSGKLLPGTSSDALKAYGSTIEEARADLFGLYYLADQKLVDLHLTPNMEAYKAQYYSYMMNGLLTQLIRIKLGNTIEEAHMRNRALIANWAFEKGKENNVVELVKQNGETFVQINDYKKLRQLFGDLLAEIQRIKSEGDYNAARDLVETYAVKINPAIHKEILARYEKLHLSPYKGFINPVYSLVKDENGKVIDVIIKYDESYEDQMLRYSKDYHNLPYVND